MNLTVEQAVQRRNTAAFIAARPIDLVLLPAVRTKTANGGVIFTDGLPRLSQTLRLVEQTSNANNIPGLLASIDGKQRKITYLLLGNWDAVFAVGDHWNDSEGVRLEIGDMLPYNGYERRARVVRYA